MRIINLFSAMLVAFPLCAFATANDSAIQSSERSIENARASYVHMDKVLNGTYSNLMNGMSSKGAARLKTAQLKWIKFKENRCKKVAQGIADAAIIENVCLASLTEDRVNELNRIKAEISGNKVADDFDRFLTIMKKQNFSEGRMIAKFSVMYSTDSDWLSYVEENCQLDEGEMSFNTLPCQARLNFLRSY